MSDSVTVRFLVPSFSVNGTVYLSKDVQRRCEEGDEKAMEIVAELVRIGSGVIEVIEEKKS